MSSWLPFALSAMFLSGVADLLFRRAAVREIRPASFAALQTLFFGPTALAIALVTGSLYWTPALAFGVAIGLIAPFATYAFLRSLQSPTAASTVNTPIYRLGIVVTALLAVIVLREQMTSSRASGLLFAVTGILLLSSSSMKALRWRQTGIGWAVLGMTIVGTINFLYKLGALFGGSPPLLILVQSCTMVVISFAWARWADGGFRPSRAVWTYAPLCGVVNSSARMLLVWGLRSGDATAVVTVYGLGFVVTVVLAVVILGESLSGRKVVGLLFAFLAIWHLNR